MLYADSLHGSTSAVARHMSFAQITCHNKRIDGSKVTIFTKEFLFDVFAPENILPSSTKFCHKKLK